MAHNGQALKRAIARMVLRSFDAKEPINMPDGDPITNYEVHPISDLVTHIRVPGPYGPRYFEVRVKESL